MNHDYMFNFETSMHVHVLNNYLIFISPVSLQLQQSSSQGDVTLCTEGQDFCPHNEWLLTPADYVL